jgi:hypothetical protein
MKNKLKAKELEAFSRGRAQVQSPVPENRERD